MYRGPITGKGLMRGPIPTDSEYDRSHLFYWNTHPPGGVVTDMRDLESTIHQMRDDIDGEVCSRSRVVDALLDLRIEAEARTDVVELVDVALADLPGKNMVPASWWIEQLDMFELTAINPIEPVV